VHSNSTTATAVSEGPGSAPGRRLVKSIRWWDGFVLALAVPIFLFPDLGTSVVKLGALGAICVWLASVTMGALQNNIYSELATMMPETSGGIGVYAHEALKRYTAWVGPLVTWGYWFGWCVVLSINGILIGKYVQAAFLGGGSAATPKVVGTLVLVGMLAFNLLGLRLGRWVNYLLGALIVIPIGIIMFGPFARGLFHVSNLRPFALPGGKGLLTVGGISLIFYWMYIAGWSSYAFEAVATFAPEFSDTVKDTPKALRYSALFSVVVYGLVPLGLVGAIGQKGIAAHTIAPFDLALKSLVGNGLGTVGVLMVIAALVLSANLAGINSTRSLWQMSESGMTVKGFAGLNRLGVPHTAMIFTWASQILLIWTLGDPLYILAASNLGYILAHVAALVGFILLRRDQPEAARPIRLSNKWVVIAGVLAALNMSFIIFGAPLYGLRPMLLGMSILLAAVILYYVRTRIQDRNPS